jgi:hypothetical protein
MPGFNLNAAAVNNYSDIIINIDYINETIKLSGKDGSGAVKYMYSPNVSAGAEAMPKRQAAEKWYPIYGDEIDISKYIPDNDKNGGFIFAFRDADEIAGADGIYKSRKTSVIIKGRPSVSSADFKNYINYNSRTERIEIKSLGAYDYQVGIGSWSLNNNAPFIDASSKYNPLGGIFTIRASAVPGKSFASNEYKLKIPKAPPVPNIKINEKSGRLTGVQTSMQWSASENGPFANFRDRSGSTDIFKENIDAFELEKDASGNDCIAVYIRVASTDKTPTSPLQKLLVDKALLE